MPEIEAAAANIPVGTIIAWYAKQGNIPRRWVVCDGTNGTPDLRGRFIRGVSDMANVGSTGGTDVITIEEDNRKGSDYHWGETPWSPGPNPARGRQTFNPTPRYVDILYLMYVG